MLRYAYQNENTWDSKWQSVKPLCIANPGENKLQCTVPEAMFVPALLISLNKALAAPLWASWPGAGACIGGGGGACTGGGGGGAAGPAPALATAPYEKVNYSIIITVHVYIKGIDSAKTPFSKQQILCLAITPLYFEQTFLVNRRSYSTKREHNCKPHLHVAQGHGSILWLETAECLSSDIQLYLVAFPSPRPHFSANHKMISEQKNRSSFMNFGQSTNEGQIWLAIDAKGNVKVDRNVFIYSEIMFI